MKKEICPSRSFPDAGHEATSERNLCYEDDFYIWQDRSHEQTVAYLCEKLNATETKYPGTTVRLVYEKEVLTSLFRNVG